MGLVRFLHRYLVRQTMPGLVVGYYDRLIDAVAEPYFNRICEEVVQAFSGPVRILDVGTGTGQLPILLARANPEYKVTGIDLSRRCLDVARSRATDARLTGRVDYVRINLQRDRWQPPPFDLIISTCSLHHWRYPVRMLRAGRGLLKDGGQIWIMDEAAEAAPEARRRWVTRVEDAFSPAAIFRIVFSFESRFIAYSRRELTQLCKKADLRLASFSIMEAFFIARASKVGAVVQGP